MDSESEDSAKELVNIIHGRAKVEINKNPELKLEMAIPELIKGDALQEFFMAQKVSVVLPFQISAGLIHVQISVAS